MRSCLLLGFMYFIGVAFPALAGDIKITGLRFPVGGTPAAPSARVSIAEVSQGAQKIGFFRVSVLPLVVARGVEVRLRVEEPGVLGEIPATLAAVAKCDVQELQRVAVFCGSEPVPRLLVETVSPGREAWSLKRVRIKTPLGFRELPEGTLHLVGERSGTLTGPGVNIPLRLDLKWDPGQDPAYPR